jgi:phosphocarrier protein
MRSAHATIVNRLGLHARPAMTFVEEASKFVADITVRKCGDGEIGDGETVDGKSILQMLMLAGTCGTVIEITASGADEGSAIDALVALVAARFGEDE